MENEFIPYEEALALKELGFDESCFGYYYTLNGKNWNFADEAHYCKLDDALNIGGKFTISAPLYQQVFRWFRKEYNLLHTVNIDLSDNLKDKVYIYTIENYLGSIVDRSKEYKTYEEAELACLRKLIEIVKQNKDE